MATRYVEEYKGAKKYLVNMNLVGVEEGNVKLTRMERRILHVPVKFTLVDLENAVKKLKIKMGQKVEEEKLPDMTIEEHITEHKMWQEKYGKVEEKKEEKKVEEIAFPVATDDFVEGDMLPDYDINQYWDMISHSDNPFWDHFDDYDFTFA